MTATNDGTAAGGGRYVMLSVGELVYESRPGETLAGFVRRGCGLWHGPGDLDACTQDSIFVEVGADYHAATRHSDRWLVRAVLFVRGRSSRVVFEDGAVWGFDGEGFVPGEKKTCRPWP